MQRTIELIDQIKNDGRKKMKLIRMWMFGLVVCILVSATSAKAQIAGSGTPGTVPVFGPTSTTVTDSPITVSGGNVGIGTTALTAKLAVSGSSNAIQLDSYVSNGNPIIIGSHYTGTNDVKAQILFLNPLNSYSSALGFATQPEIQGASAVERMRIDQNGNVGIGTTSPAAPLEVAGSVAAVTPLSIYRYGCNWYQCGVSEDFALQNSAYNRVVFASMAGAIVNANAGSETGAFFFKTLKSGTLNTAMVIDQNSNVGIGTTSPGAKLDVNGSINISGSGAGITFPNNGGTQTVAWTGTTCGGDYAESVDVSGDRKSYEPGDVLVIGEESGSDVTKSSEPYSTLVVGVYSTKPGVIGRRQTTDPKTASTEVPMAMVGIVPTKVSAENGPIKRGDLLVTSSISGYAMKGTDRSLLTGAVIGKALGHLDSGTGVIEVVVTLQ